MAMILAAEGSSWWDQARETGGFGSSEKKYGSLLLPSVLIPPAKPSQEVWWRWVTIGSFQSNVIDQKYHFPTSVSDLDPRKLNILYMY